MLTQLWTHLVVAELYPTVPRSQSVGIGKVIKAFPHCFALSAVVTQTSTTTIILVVYSDKIPYSVRCSCSCTYKPLWNISAVDTVAWFVLALTLVFR